MQVMKNQDISNWQEAGLPAMADSAKQLQEVQARVNLNPVHSVVNDEVESAPYNAEDVKMAVRDIADMSEKTMIMFVLLGKLGRAVRENRDEAFVPEKLEIGFPVSQLTPEIKSLFKTWNFEETDYGYKYYFTPPTKWDIKIPVEIHVFKRKYKFFSNPDFGFFGVDNFLIPNPFDKYWKARHLIQ